MIIVTASLTSRKRMTAALNAALALHVVIILGIRFQPFAPEPAAPPPLRVALQTHANRVAPTVPAPEAAADHVGGGEALEAPPVVPEVVRHEGKAVLTAEVRDEETIGDAPEPVPDPALDEAADESDEVVPESALPTPARRRLSATSLMRQARQIAMSAANGLDRQSRSADRDADAQGPTTKFSVREAYIQAWVQKVQQWGNRNFPDEARRDGLTGSLTLSVTIRADGTVADMALVRTSGHEILDEAARRIVRLAAPYSPFPETLREDYGDSLTIKRTWQFLQGNRLASG